MTTDVWGKFTERVTSATGSKDNEYEFGAFSKWLDQKSKETVGAFIPTTSLTISVVTFVKKSRDG